MFKHILLPTDGSKLSGKAVKQAIGVAAALGARITAVNVVGGYQLHLMDEGYAVPDVPALKTRFEEAESAAARKILDTVRKSAAEAGVECDTVTATSNLPHDAIITQAKKSGCDLIIMASHGRKGLQGLLLGSETVKVLTHSTIPVLVIR
jgi:nucleotide-binding universal stress UspA family protein